MRIGINALYLRPGGVGGSEVYLRNIVRHLRMRGHELVVYASEEGAASFVAEERLTLVAMLRGRFSQWKRLASENLLLPSRLVKDQVDVLLNPANFAAVVSNPVPQVTTIHDLQHVALPECFDATTRLARSVLFWTTLAQSQAAIAISEFTRAAIINRYDVKEERIVTVYHGAELGAIPSAERVASVRAKYDLPAEYLYYPAILARHKNHEVLLRAFAALPNKTAWLIFTGSGDTLGDWLHRLIHDLGLGSRVRHLGFIPRADVMPILASCRALLFPSLFEGFGLPIIEAMGCSVPVVATTATSIPEICNGAALLVDPRSVTAWVESISRVLTSTELRSRLVASGLDNASRFSWSKCAQETEHVLMAARAVRRKAGVLRKARPRVGGPSASTS